MTVSSTDQTARGLLSDIKLKTDKTAAKHASFLILWFSRFLNGIIKKGDWVKLLLRAEKLSRKFRLSEICSEEKFAENFGELFLYKENHALDAWFDEAYGVE